MKSLNHSFQNSKRFWKKNEDVYAICCRPEVAGDVISGESVKTIEYYAALNFEVASFSSFRDIPKKYFATAADIDDTSKRKCIRASLTKYRHLTGLHIYELTIKINQLKTRQEHS